MDYTNPAELDDDRIAIAAKRIIRQYRLRQTDRSEGSVDVGSRPPVRGPDDVQSLRLAIDTMELAIEHLQRLQVSREAVFMEVIERVERNAAKTAGRVDALVGEVSRIASTPVLDMDLLLDDQRAMAVGVVAEFGKMMELCRSLLEETAQMHAESMKAIYAFKTPRPPNA